MSYLTQLFVDTVYPIQLSTSDIWICHNRYIALYPSWVDTSRLTLVAFPTLSLISFKLHDFVEEILSNKDFDRTTLANKGDQE